MSIFYSVEAEIYDHLYLLIYSLWLKAFFKLKYWKSVIIIQILKEVDITVKMNDDSLSVSLYSISHIAGYSALKEISAS